DDLADLGVPVLVARGGDGSFVSDEVADRYREAVPDVEIVDIPESGHDLFRPSRTAYPRAVLDFVARRVATASRSGLHRRRHEPRCGARWLSYDAWLQRPATDRPTALQES